MPELLSLGDTKNISFVEFESPKLIVPFGTEKLAATCCAAVNRLLCWILPRDDTLTWIMNISFDYEMMETSDFTVTVFSKCIWKPATRLAYIRKLLLKHSSGILSFFRLLTELVSCLLASRNCASFRHARVNYENTMVRSLVLTAKKQ